MTVDALGVEDRVTFLKDELLRRGDSGPKVLDLQRHLVEAGYNLKPDGDFGSNTEKAVIAFQKSKGLVVDGVVGPKTLTLLCGKCTTHKFLTHKDLEAAAKSLSVPIAAVMAVNEVESKGTGFLASGRPVILYERHIMYRELRDYGVDPVQAMRNAPGLVNTARGGYLGGEKEWLRMEKAQQICHDAALESASWGAYQIMGFHWELLGFDSVQDYVDFVSVNEANQLECFVRFIKSQKALWVALKALDWATFARRYNGPKYKENKYDTKLKTAFDRAVLVLAA